MDQDAPVRTGLDALPIDAGNLRLRRLTPADAPILLRLSNEEAYRRWLPSQVYPDEDRARAAVEHLVAQYGNPGGPRVVPCVLGIEHGEPGTLVGHVGLSPWEREVEIGYAVGAAHQRRGLATRAVRTASDWALRSFRLDRILALVAAGNVASRRVLARAGFRHELDRVMPFQGSEQAVAVHVLGPAGG